MARALGLGLGLHPFERRAGQPHAPAAIRRTPAAVLRSVEWEAIRVAGHAM
jgi:hypothetical protein